MNNLHLTNSLTNKKEVFNPINKDKISLYACGPTVYDNPHVGNARALVVFDLLFRILIELYGEKKVTYVRNITDIDDKIIEASKIKKIDISDLTKTVTEKFHKDCKVLFCLNPTQEPRATDHVDDMISMTKKIIEKNAAYEKQGHVFFSVSSFKKYGKLSNKNLDDLKVGARVEVSKLKKDPLDFVLWKPSANDDPGWDSPWGRGRPGWHLECSAMSEKCLGLPFDIHAGGVDLTFPHHENEIAQSCSIKKSKNPKSFARNWFHNGFVMSNGEKMSKSLGNIRLIHDIKKEFSGEIIRFALLTTHYRQPLNWNNEILNQSKRNLDKFYRLLNTLCNVEVEEISYKDIPTEFLDCLLDDLNTPKAFAYLYKLINNFSLKEDKEKIMFKRIILSTGKILGLFQSNPEKWLGYESKNEISKDINDLIELRNQAREKKDFLKADEYREKLKEMGIEIEDNQSGTKWRRK